MRENDGKEGGKGTIPESDAESVLDAIDQMQETGTFDSTHLPKDPVIRKRLDEILVTIRTVQDFALCISKGDLDCRLEAKGVSAGSLKFLQSNLRHLTWQAQQIAAGDFSQRVDFMGEFSEAFNHMVMALDAARVEMKQRERELSSLNAQLLTEVTVRRQAEEALQESNDRFLAFIKEAAMRLKNPLEVVEENLTTLLNDIDQGESEPKTVSLQLMIQIKYLEQIRKNLIELNTAIIEHSGEISDASKKFLTG